MSEHKPIAEAELERIAQRGAMHRDSWLNQHLNDFITGLISHGYVVTTDAPDGCAARIALVDESGAGVRSVACPTRRTVRDIIRADAAGRSS